MERSQEENLSLSATVWVEDYRPYYNLCYPLLKSQDSFIQTRSLMTSSSVQLLLVLICHVMIIFLSWLERTTHLNSFLTLVFYVIIRMAPQLTRLWTLVSQQPTL
uniref:Uncharacterized protein n=1 Tax=Cacopsylla melanoneura TaxID=428564 RepID=A0A8D8V083_9HEMI